MRRMPPDPEATANVSTHQITELLHAWREGDDQALSALTPLVHAELRKLALSYMRRERRNHSLQATGLVNECFLRLAEARGIEWQDRGHFFALAARSMRRILVDLARQWSAARRGGGAVHVALEHCGDALPTADSPDLVSLDDALDALAAIDERKSRVVELRFFGGLSNDEIARVLDVSTKTVIREWQMAKVWLLRELSGT
jgi:RNA polymerase sigma-70 factor, ECF subfamily